MCGRYNIVTDAQALYDGFEVIASLDLAPRYNVAPSQDVLAIRQSEQGNEAVMLRWGLIPFWAKDTKIGYKTINARAETVATKPAFRAAYKNRRCLIPASGFYEWQREKDGSKQPYNICMTDKRLFAFAGLWEHWQGPEGKVIESCTIIVTEANELIAPVHNRMPVILDKSDYDAWLDPSNKAVAPLLKSYPSDEMMTYPVSTMVNSPRNDSAELLERVGRGA